MTEPTFWSSFREVDAADDPAALAAYLDAYNALAPVTAGKEESRALLRLRAGDSVLDVGCGAGDDTRALQAIVGEQGRAVGVDASESLIAEARSRAAADSPAVEFVVADASALPFADDAFRGCRCDRTLQHLETPAVALAEMIRVVAAGGRLVVTETGNALEGEPTVDSDLMTRARERFAPIGAREGWFGTFVPLLLSRAGLEDIGVTERRGTLPDFDSATLAFNFETSVRAMVEAGERSAAEAADWLAGLRADVEDGRLRAVVRVFHFFGTVPGASSSES